MSVNMMKGVGVETPTKTRGLPPIGPRATVVKSFPPVAREHFGSRWGLTVEIVPVPLYPFTVCTSSAFHEIEREQAVTFFFVALQVEFGNEGSYMDSIRDVKAAWKEGHSPVEMNKPLAPNIV